METNVRPLRLGAVGGIVIQLGWLMWMFGLEYEVPWGAAIGISIGVAALGAGLVYAAAQGSQRRAFLATVILSSGIVWGLLWGLIGSAAAEILVAPLFRTAGFVFGPPAGGVFGCFLALRPRAELSGIPELVVLGAIAGAGAGVTPILSAVLAEGSFENWGGSLIVLAIMGALAGMACLWMVSLAARYCLTPST
jgi:hypothetical protein